jgi:hypothetical protein
MIAARSRRRGRQLDGGMEKIRRLWDGEVPLETTFWTYTIAIGFAVNGVCTVIALFLATLDAPGLVILAMLLLALPYNIFTTVAVWRSAGNYRGDPKWANLARAAAVLWAVLASVL